MTLDDKIKLVERIGWPTRAHYKEFCELLPDRHDRSLYSRGATCFLMRGVQMKDVRHLLQNEAQCKWLRTKNLGVKTYDWWVAFLEIDRTKRPECPGHGIYPSGVRFCKGNW
jgi:hypothetical protein